MLQAALAQRRAGRAARGRDRPAAAAAGTGCWRPSTPGCRSCSPTARRRSGDEIAGRARRPPRCTGCSRARSARARPWSRCGPCSRWSTPAARRRCSRPPRCSPPSTPGPCARCSARWPRAGLFGGGRPTRAPGWPCSPGRSAPKARRQALLEAARGEAGIVVGTHALLSGAGAVRRPRPGRGRRAAPLRGRAARRAARQGRRPPHLLVMTATPIPRTVAMTVFGDLEVSTLRELPAGRQPIATHVVPGRQRRLVDRTWARVREEVDAGHRAYVVCPRITRTRTRRPADGLRRRAGRSLDPTAGPGRGARRPRRRCAPCSRSSRAARAARAGGVGSASCTGGCRAEREGRGDGAGSPPARRRCSWPPP